MSLMMGSVTEFDQPAFGEKRPGEAEESLPKEFRSQFRSMVEGVHFLAHKRGWHPWRQYAVIADLIRNGWRGPGPSLEALRK
jgi:hypothetical protein